jgi:hypothetical protein
MEKKFSKKITNPKTGREKTVKYGQKGATIKPGTSKGDSSLCWSNEEASRSREESQ